MASPANQVKTLLWDKIIPISYATCASLLYLAFALDAIVFALLALLLMIVTTIEDLHSMEGGSQ